MSDDLPTVTRVDDEHGSHIEPPCDPKWTSLEKLQWHAACVALDCPSLRIRVTRWPKTPPTYSLTVGGTSIGDQPFQDAWGYLNGVGTGFREAARDRDTP